MLIETIPESIFLEIATCDEDNMKTWSDYLFSNEKRYSKEEITDVFENIIGRDNVDCKKFGLPYNEDIDDDATCYKIGEILLLNDVDTDDKIIDQGFEFEDDISIIIESAKNNK